MKKNVISIKQDVDEFVRQAHMRVGLKTLVGVVMSTPVDTGRARFNWIVNQNESSGKTKIMPATPSLGGSFAIEQGKGVLKTTKPYTETFIENNLPYIEYLNNGHSMQAKPGFIETVINKVIASES